MASVYSTRACGKTHCWIHSTKIGQVFPRCQEQARPFVVGDLNAFVVVVVVVGVIIILIDFAVFVIGTKDGIVMRIPRRRRVINNSSFGKG